MWYILRVRGYTGFHAIWSMAGVGLAKKILADELKIREEWLILIEERERI